LIEKASSFEKAEERALQELGLKDSLTDWK